MVILKRFLEVSLISESDKDNIYPSLQGDAHLPLLAGPEPLEAAPDVPLVDREGTQFSRK